MAQRNASYRFISRAATLHAAIEVNGRHCPSNEVVSIQLVGYTDETEMHEGKPVTVKQPRFAFSYSPVIVETHLPLHDHRDNFHGGFAFAWYHP